MPNIRSLNEIILSLLDFYRVAQPDLDTKPGEEARDLFVEGPSVPISLIYEELSRAASSNSIKNSFGTDLDKEAANYGLRRNDATKANGIAILTFSSLPAPVAITRGSLIPSNSGISFVSTTSLTADPAQSNLYKSIATRYRSDLDFVGITDEYAVEITVEASSPGAFGNISKYSLRKPNIAGVNNATNVSSFINGSDQEGDEAFKQRIYSSFSGSSVGRAIAYKNIAINTPGTLDAVVIEPGDPLMVRDGTQVVTAADGTKTIIQDGSGGSVDVLILGSQPSENIDTFIYKDKSNTNDPTNPLNDFVLGQVAGDTSKTITQKRYNLIKNGTLPAQPVENVLEVSGTLSGSNFQAKTVDSLGRVFGNYEIIKDSTPYNGSPFGSDKFHWVSNKISDFQEDRIKAVFNSQDQVTFSDVLGLSLATQNVKIINENSNVYSSDNSYVQLLHTPINTVTRVFNATTGERYIIEDQNPDGTSNLNYSGRIKISGNTLPSSTDILQVDYEWYFQYDPYIDFDGKYLDNNLRQVSDSVDWGYSNNVRKENVLLTKNGSGTYFIGSTLHPITSIIDTSLLEEQDGYVSLYSGRSVVYLNGLVTDISSIDSIKIKNTNKEVYKTSEKNGFFSSVKTSVSFQVRYNVTVTLPTDANVAENVAVTVRYNKKNVFIVNNNTGSFNLNQLTIPVSNISTSASNVVLEVNYLSNVQELFSTTINNLTASKVSNGFVLGTTLTAKSNLQNVLRSEHVSLLNNGTNFYGKLNVLSTNTTLVAKNIVSAIRVSDGLELWNADNPGTISIDTDNKYLINFTTFNTPVLNDKVLVLYYANDIRRFQPCTYQNEIFNKLFSTVVYNPSLDQYSVDLVPFITESSLNFYVTDGYSDSYLASSNDGALVLDSFTSYSTPFNSIPNIKGKKLKIYNSTNQNNNNTFDIVGIDTFTNTITLTNSIDYISENQVSVIRLSDGQELFNSTGTFDPLNKKIILPTTNYPQNNDKVVVLFYNYNCIRQAPTNLSLNINDQINNSGVITVKGTSFHKAQDIVFSATSDGLTQDLIEALRKSLNLNSSVSIDPTIQIVRVVKLEKVDATTDDEVVSVLTSYDLKQVQLRNDFYFTNEVCINENLTNYQFVIPNTVNNSSNSPAVGDKLRATFYYIIPSDTENLFFARNGTLYTNKKFVTLDNIFISSGFASSTSAKLTINNLNQPFVSSRYKITYDYTAPKVNERIAIRYNYNRLISSVTFNIENARIINADVLVKQAIEKLVDVTMNVVVKSDYLDQASIITQSVKDQVAKFINSNTLGAIVDSSDLVNVAYSVDGVDRVRILYFNQDLRAGQVASLTAQSNEYFVANNIVVNEEKR